MVTGFIVQGHHTQQHCTGLWLNFHLNVFSVAVPPIFMFIVCINQPFYWFLGLVAPFSQVSMAGHPPPVRCASAAYVCTRMCTCT